MITKETHTFKVVKNCQIKADVYSISDNAIRPAIMWIHGGALIMGNRESIRLEQVDMYVGAGYTLVSVDYRLAPETKLGDIIKDIQDAFSWIREKGPKLFHIDANRLTVIGHSAGGYLALMTGFCVSPRPSAIVSFYGYGDIVGDWFSRPDKFYCQQPLVPREEAYKTVGGPIISMATSTTTRRLFYLYCRQNGLWPKEITGHDPDTDPDFFNPFCSIRNITKEYPPTLLLHGDTDTDVPYDQSVIMAEELARFQIDHELITVINGEHGFDKAGMEEPQVKSAFKRILEFLNYHLHYGVS